MKGYLGRRGEAWELRVYLGIDPVTRKQRYATRTFRGGKREAQRLLAEMVLEAERGLAVRTTATVGELLEAWFELAQHDFSPKTVQRDPRHDGPLPDPEARRGAAHEAQGERPRLVLPSADG